MWNAAEVEQFLPAKMKQYIAKNNIEFYTLDATTIAAEIGLGNRINMIMQSAFFKLADVIPLDDAVKYLKNSIYKTYGKKGDKIVNLNNQAVDFGIEKLVKVEVPASWATAVDAASEAKKAVPEFIEKILMPMNAQEGDSLPVSTFAGREDGTFDCGSAAFEKRGIAVNIPEWQPENCIQCNQCSFVCPHAAIRPFLLTADEKAKAPADMKSLQASGKGLEAYTYKLQVSPLDCTGCGNCADICPAKNKALVMKGLDTQVTEEIPNWDYLSMLPVKGDAMPLTTVKGSQFAQPLFEFSGACAGCGETPYIKVVTQLFGDRMMIANATGCSSIWGGSAPATPYTKNAEGKGPAWANSLFEDNAEFGLGMTLGVNAIRTQMVAAAEELINLNVSAELTAALTKWLAGMNDGKASKEAAPDVLKVLGTKAEGKAAELINFFNVNKDYLIKQSQWILGGDGWAYDIGFGGLDHVLASGENVNVLVFDTEVYSNTGGQSSKATPTGAIAKFAASGKKIKKKDLGMIAATYGYVYVAQVSMGADKNHFIKVLLEAEAYDGPSLIIAYAPCIAHGIKQGMGRTQNRAKEAVESGYWHLWRFNPTLKEEGKNPFTLDSKEPTTPFKDFIMGEARYTTLKHEFPEIADSLFDRAGAEATDRLKGYQRMAKMEF
jgi:pyruvate-ferredoxin/flavodoxin oxidoreductase